MSYGWIAFLVVVSVLGLLGWLTLAALRHERKELEQIVLRNADLFRREKTNAR